MSIVAANTTTQKLFDTAKTTLRKILQDFLARAAPNVAPLITLLDQAKQALHKAPKTEANTLDKREFAQARKNILQAFKGTFNPLTELWGFLKSVLGLHNEDNQEIKTLRKFTNLASQYGTTNHAVEAVETLINLISQTLKARQGFFSNFFKLNTLKEDPLISSLTQSIKAWLPRVDHIDHLRYFANVLTNKMPQFIADNLGQMARDLVTRAEKALASS